MITILPNTQYMQRTVYYVPGGCSQGVKKKGTYGSVADPGGGGR